MKMLERRGVKEGGRPWRRSRPGRPNTPELWLQGQGRFAAFGKADSRGSNLADEKVV